MFKELSLESLEKLRSLMQENSIDAFYFSGHDSHISDTAAACFDIKPFLSGFTGSTGEILITQTESFLWTDGRYFLQARNQLYPHFTMMGDDLDFPSLVSWIRKHMKGKILGFDSTSTSISFIKGLLESFEEMGETLSIKPMSNLWEKIWKNRPVQEFNHIRLFPAMGVEASVKIQRIRSIMKEYKANAHVISGLEDIAWLLNLRGEDLTYAEVFYAYLIIEDKRTRLFVSLEILKKDICLAIKSAGVEIFPYRTFFNVLGSLSGRVWLEAQRTCYQVLESLGEEGKPFFKMNPSSLMKIRKSSMEIEGFEEAHLREGVVWLSLWMWLKENADRKHEIRETDIVKKLRELRSKQSTFVRESFSPIIGWADHGAIVHYSVNSETDRFFKGEGLLLIDSGAHYVMGTTDMTRTFALGLVIPEMKRDYTNVLKGHIRIAMLKFPAGTCGEHIDAFAREALWRNGLNYNHGTGHGVGSCLNVHEGPCRISTNISGIPLEPRMVISNEPGVYREGAYGIRLENLIWVDLDEETSSGKFYKFKTLSLCPFEARLIDRSMLSKEELIWLSDYHILVYDNLSPFIGEEEKSFLAKNKAYFTQLVEGVGVDLDSILQ